MPRLENELRRLGGRPACRQPRDERPLKPGPQPDPVHDPHDATPQRSAHEVAAALHAEFPHDALSVPMQRLRRRAELFSGALIVAPVAVR